MKRFKSTLTESFIFFVAALFIGCGVYALFNSTPEDSDKELCVRSATGKYHCTNPDFDGCFIPSNGTPAYCVNKKSKP